MTVTVARLRLAWLLVVLSPAAPFVLTRDAGAHPDDRTNAIAASQQPAVIGLDHIPIAVNDLDQAAERFRALGFALKPGRPHPNGIRNQHAKFPDGTELELITAPAARDALTSTYRRHLASGDGPAFLALFAPEAPRRPRPLEPPLDYLFFGSRNVSPTDRPEHFAHVNTGDAFIAVWLAGDDLWRERTLFEKLGAPTSRQEVQVPDRTTAEVAHFREGTAIFLPAARQIVPGRRIVGATVRVRSVSEVRRHLARQSIPTHTSSGPAGSSIFVAPAHANGLWIEFRQNVSR
jgi:hypothetical protein